MNREEIIERIKNELNPNKWYEWRCIMQCCLQQTITELFLDEILPEVLRDLIEIDFSDNMEFIRWNWQAIHKIKERAKEKYNITL